MQKRRQNNITAMNRLAILVGALATSCATALKHSAPPARWLNPPQNVGYYLRRG
ncbi:MAG: hypothetical protein LBE74_04465 [Treponema sp.]|nr:hypothetical protein [Treponema sp.]